MSMFFNILSCGADGANCCSDYKLATILDILNKTLKIFQIMIPIILIVMLAIQITKMMANPDDDASKKSIVNKCIGLLVFFFLPTIVNAILLRVPSNLELSSCWKQASATNKILSKNNYNNNSNNSTTSNNSSSKATNKSGKTVQKKKLSKKAQKLKSNKTKPVKTKRKKTTIKPKRSAKSTINYNTNKKLKNLKHKTVGSDKGKSLVAYAKKFLGKRNKSGGLRYCYGGSNPNKCTDCSGFVGYVFKHFGISLPRQSTSIPSTSAKYKKVTNGKLKAGDIIVYSSRHVAIATGKGNQIIHASCEKVGITLTDSYKRGGTGKITIMRLNKIN